MKRVLLSVSIVVILLGIASSLIDSSPARNPSSEKIAKARSAVAITNVAKTSGGTGVILTSTVSKSTILTNNHVCELFKRGESLVSTVDGKDYLVNSYKQSLYHDLCLVYVTADLGITTPISNRLPRLLETAIVAGHPALYPITLTEGHFSGRVSIPVRIGQRNCTEEELHNPDLTLECLFFGFPIVKTFDAQYITATIMPGSSGSAVYNSDGELSGLVFAGAGNLGYGFIVPLEYIINFVNYESLKTPLQVVDHLVRITSHED